MKIDNMREEHQEKLIRDAEKDRCTAGAGTRKAGRRRMSRVKPVGFIAVSIGDGMNEIFRELGVDSHH